MKKAKEIVLHWLMMTAAALGSFTVQLLFMKDTGETSSSFLFSSRIYKANTVCVLLGYVLFFSLHLLIWNKFQKQELKAAKEKGTGYALLYCICVLLVSLIIFALSIFILFACFTGMSAKIEPEIVNFGGLIFAGYIFLFTAANLIIIIKKDKGSA